MSSWIIQTMEYDVDLESLLRDRLREGGAPFALSAAWGGVGVRMEGRQGLQALASALGGVLLHDLVTFEVAGMADEMPLPLAAAPSFRNRDRFSAHNRHRPT